MRKFSLPHNFLKKFCSIFFLFLLFLKQFSQQFSENFILFAVFIRYVRVLRSLLGFCQTFFNFSLLVNFQQKCSCQNFQSNCAQLILLVTGWTPNQFSSVPSSKHRFLLNSRLNYYLLVEFSKFVDSQFFTQEIYYRKMFNFSNNNYEYRFTISTYSEEKSFTLNLLFIFISISMDVL